MWHHRAMAESRLVDASRPQSWRRWSVFAASAVLIVAITSLVRHAYRPLDWDDRWDDEW